MEIVPTGKIRELDEMRLDDIVGACPEVRLALTSVYIHVPVSIWNSDHPNGDGGSTTACLMSSLHRV